MSYFKAYDIALQRNSGERIKVRSYQEKLRLAQGKLPGEEKQARARLADTRKYMRKVGELRKRENAQHGDIDKQVRGQEAKILGSAKDLSRQAGEARINIGKYRSAALEQKKLAIANHQDLVRRFWRDTLMGLEVLTLKQGQFDLMIYRACTALSRAVFGRGTAKFRVIYPQLPVVTEGEMPPKWSEIKGADNRISQIAKAEREQNGKIRGHEDKLKGAIASLGERSRTAHDGVKKRVAERGKQLLKGKEQERKLIKHLKYIAGRKAELSGEEGRMTDAERQLAARKGGILQARAKAAARLKAAQQSALTNINRFVAATNSRTKMNPLKFAPVITKWLAENHPLVLENYRRAVAAQGRMQKKK